MANNGSTNAGAAEAAAAGATVISEPRRGYGCASAAGVAAAHSADVIAFIDGDGSFLLAELPDGDILADPRRPGRSRPRLTADRPRGDRSDAAATALR